MSNRGYDKYLYLEHLRNEYSCCECGYRKGMDHHPGIRCPTTGRCGSCGSDWPCEDHSGFVPTKLKIKVNRPSYVRK